MKKTAIIALFALILSFGANAQNWSIGSFYALGKYKSGNVVDLTYNGVGVEFGRDINIIKEGFSFYPTISGNYSWAEETFADYTYASVNLGLNLKYAFGKGGFKPFIYGGIVPYYCLIDSTTMKGVSDITNNDGNYFGLCAGGGIGFDIASIVRIKAGYEIPVVGLMDKESSSVINAGIAFLF